MFQNDNLKIYIFMNKKKIPKSWYKYNESFSSDRIKTANLIPKINISLKNGFNLFFFIAQCKTINKLESCKKKRLLRVIQQIKFQYLV